MWLVCSVGETDWRAEIEAFRKGVAEDASNVQQQAQHAAREGAARLEALPQQAAKAKFPPVDSAKVKSQLDQVLSGFSQIGSQNQNQHLNSGSSPYRVNHIDSK